MRRYFFSEIWRSNRTRTKEPIWTGALSMSSVCSCFFDAPHLWSENMEQLAQQHILIRRCPSFIVELVTCHCLILQSTFTTLMSLPTISIDEPICPQTSNTKQSRNGALKILLHSSHSGIFLRNSQRFLFLPGFHLCWSVAVSQHLRVSM